MARTSRSISARAPRRIESRGASTAGSALHPLRWSHSCDRATGGRRSRERRRPRFPEASKGHDSAWFQGTSSAGARAGGGDRRTSAPIDTPQPRVFAREGHAAGARSVSFPGLRARAGVSAPAARPNPTVRPDRLSADQGFGYPAAPSGVRASLPRLASPTLPPRPPPPSHAASRLPGTPGSRAPRRKPHRTKTRSRR